MQKQRYSDRPIYKHKGFFAPSTSIKNLKYDVFRRV